MAALEALVEKARTSITHAREQPVPLTPKYPTLSGIDPAKDACASISDSLLKINVPAYREARRLHNADVAKYFSAPLKEAIYAFDKNFSPALSQTVSSEEFANPETYAAVGRARKYANRCRFELRQLQYPILRILMGRSLIIFLLGLSIIYAIYYLYFYGSHVAAPLSHPAEVFNSAGNAAKTAVSELNGVNSFVDGIKVLVKTLTDLFSEVPPLIVAGTAAFVALRRLLVR